MAIRDTDYMFASARVAAFEGSSTRRERMDRILDASDIHDLASAIGADTSGEIDLDSLTDDMLRQAASVMLEAAPEPELLHFMLYPYDCCNIKTAIKSEIAERKCEAEDLFACGSVSAEAILSAVEARDFSAFPVHMGEAAKEAMDAYGKTRDPRSIDFILDRACFLDAADCAKKSGAALAMNLCALKADGVNLITFIRILRMGLEESAAAELFDRAFVPGGEIAKEAFLSCREGGEEAVLEKFSSVGMGGALSSAVSAMNGDMPLSEMERLCENARLLLIAKVKYQAFGIETLISFFTVRECEVKNIRMAAASVRFGASGLSEARDYIRSCFRTAYL